MGLVFPNHEFAYYVRLLRSDEEESIKHALQCISWGVKKGKVLLPGQQLVVMPSIVSSLDSSAVKVRRWGFVLLAFLGRSSIPRKTLNSFVPKIEKALCSKETDRENRTWACACLFSLLPSEMAWKKVRDSDIEFTEDQLRLTELLSAIDVRSEPVVNLEIGESTDPLMAQWLALTYGYAYSDLLDQTQQSKKADRLITPMTSHEDDRVREYALWSLAHTKGGSHNHLRLPFDDYIQGPPNVRKWFYRLVVKDPEISKSSFEIVEAASFDQSRLVREGLAMALRSRYDSNLATFLIEWYARESNDLVRLRLLEHFAMHWHCHGDYFEIIAEAIDAGDSTVITCIKATMSKESANAFNEALGRRSLAGPIYFHTGDYIHTGDFRVKKKVVNKNVSISSAGPTSGIYNFGIVEGSIDASMNKLQSSQLSNDIASEVAEILKEFVSELKKASDLPEEAREELGSSLEDFAIEVSAEARDKKVLNRILLSIKGLLHYLPSGLSLVDRGLEFVERLREIISQF